MFKYNVGEIVRVNSTVKEIVKIIDKTYIQVDNMKLYQVKISNGLYKDAELWFAEHEIEDI